MFLSWCRDKCRPSRRFPEFLKLRCAASLLLDCMVMRVRLGLEIRPIRRIHLDKVCMLACVGLPPLLHLSLLPVLVLALLLLVLLRFLLLARCGTLVHSIACLCVAVHLSVFSSVVSNVPQGGRVPKVGVSSPPEDLRPVSEVEVAVRFPGRRPEPGSRWSRGHIRHDQGHARARLSLFIRVWTRSSSQTIN